MLPNRHPAIRLSLLASLLGLLSACNNQAVERLFAADPKLQESPVTISSSPQDNQPSQTDNQLPADFPSDIPIYPEANLLNVNQGSDQGVETLWASTDSVNSVESFYQKAFQSNNWQLETPSSQDANNSLSARQGDLQVTVSISPQAETGDANRATTFAIQYQRATNGVETNADNSPQTQIASDSALDFSDLDQAPQQLQSYIEDLGTLGILTSNSAANKSNSAATDNKFNPSQNITRRDFARWLVAANNRFYANRPSQQIRLAAKDVQPAFSDVKPSDPDFAVIQSLADAGIIPSSLSGDSTSVLFRPDAPLTREDLIAWKAPLDNRQGLPSASIDAVKQAWGFQDVAKINPNALRAILADYQNGEQSNIRRAFGYTTLFQPKKPVTRADAAAALWYFGSQGEGLSAKDALQLNEQQSQ